MTRLYLVRHGRAAAGFGEAMNPGLEPSGREQAREAARKLAPLGPLNILTSPLARARQTARPLAALWTRVPVIEPAIAEIPSPKGMALAERAAWLRKLMAGTWQDAPPALANWREAVFVKLISQNQDAVIFSHFIAINAAVGVALDDDRVVVFSPDNCSVTVIDVEYETLRLVEKGHEAQTQVN